MAQLTWRELGAGRTEWSHTSRLRVRRDGQEAERRLVEVVTVQEGVLLSATALRAGAGRAERHGARWDPGSRDLMIEGPAGARRLPIPAGGVGSLLEAAFRLARQGATGDHQTVYDPAEARLGTVTVVQARDREGWTETRELGVRVRSRWRPGRRLPDEVILPDLGLTYRAVGVRAPRAEVLEGLETGGIPGRGAMRPGASVRLGPPAAWEATGCAENRARLGRAGPACALPETGARRQPSSPGPAVLALANRVPPGPVLDRARWLAGAVAEALDPAIGAGGLWQDPPEAALTAGRGDCNEAAGVFAEAGSAAGLVVRRRTGAVWDAPAATFWPHAWVEVRTGTGWVRVDPSRGEAPARGTYLDLGDGEDLAARLRAAAAALAGGWVEAVPEVRGDALPRPPDPPRRAR